jgi:translation initiation factor RLI1
MYGQLDRPTPWYEPNGFVFYVQPTLSDKARGLFGNNRIGKTISVKILSERPARARKSSTTGRLLRGANGLWWDRALRLPLAGRKPEMMIAIKPQDIDQIQKIFGGTIVERLIPRVFLIVPG